MDNLSCHRSPAIRHAIEDTGAQLWFLPNYGPDLNPIELLFAKLKALLRKARCRTNKVLWARAAIIFSIAATRQLRTYEIRFS